MPKVASRRRLEFSEAELREQYLTQQLSSLAIARQRGCATSSVLSALARFGIDRRPWRKDPVYPRQSFSGDPLEKAYLIGFRDGDLHVHKANHLETSRTIVVACASSRVEQIELIRALFEPYGRVSVSTLPRQSVITCWVDLSFRFLLQKSEHVPAWVLRNRRNFAAGYIDAEGHIGVKRSTNASQLVIRSGDLGILDSCHGKLLELGIDCPPVSLVRLAGERDGANGAIYRRDYWCLAVYQQDALHQLFRLISPYMRHKKRRLDMLAASENLRERLVLRRRDLR